MAGDRRVVAGHCREKHGNQFKQQSPNSVAQPSYYCCITVVLLYHYFIITLSLLYHYFIITLSLLYHYFIITLS